MDWQHKALGGRHRGSKVTHRAGAAAIGIGCVAGLAPALGLLGGCSKSTESAPPSAPLRLAMDKWPGYYPALLAAELGYFSARQLEVEVSFPADTDRMLAEFAAGRYDIIAVAMGDLITATHGRVPMQVFLVSDESAGGDAVLARPGVDLQGQGRLRLATNLGGFGELLCREFLHARHINDKRIAWLNADAADVPRLLAAGEVELGHTWEPYATEAEAAGARRVFSSADTPGLIPDVLAASRALLDRRHDELQRFSSAWMQAVDWWLAHPEEAATRLQQRLRNGPIALKGIKLLGLEDNRRLLGAEGPAAMAPVVARYSAFFLDKGSLARPVEPADLLRADLLP